MSHQITLKTNSLPLCAWNSRCSLGFVSDLLQAYLIHQISACPNHPWEQVHTAAKCFVILHSCAECLKFKEYWLIGTHLSVDETIERFIGQSAEIVNIPSKPTPEGFKIRVLANQGYILDWLHHVKGEGPWDLDSFFTKDLGFLNTQAVVLDLINQEGIPNGNRCIVWLDNLFPSVRLCEVAKERGFGVAGTVRTTKTQREAIEEISGLLEQKKQIEKNRGLTPEISELKTLHANHLEWGTLYGHVSKGNDVLQLAWKDQNVVLFVTTVHDGKESVIRSRKRPPKTASNSASSRRVFSPNEAVKDLPIPEFIDAYNHYMNGVDQADQLRAYNTIQRPHRRTWLPLWHFLLDTTVTNCWKIAQTSPQSRFGKQKNRFTHKDFIDELINGLFIHSERLAPHRTRAPLTNQIRHIQSTHHEMVRMHTKAKVCQVCVKQKRYIQKHRVQRKALGELHINVGRPSNKLKDRRDYHPRSAFGCSICNIYLCNNGRCFQEHLDIIR